MERALDTKKTFHVAVFGFSAQEMRVLKSMAWLSTTRARSYVFAPHGQGAADIHLVDSDEPQAVADWSRASVQRRTPAIMVGDGSNGSDKYPALRRPIIVPRLFSLLDNITMEELHFLPELNIGAESVVNQTAIPAPAPSGPARHCALVVDDSAAVRKQIELALRISGLAADFAETGGAALERLALKQYDLIFLDVMLPGVDGYQICKSIKADPLHRKTPVIMLTGKSSPIDRFRGTLAGCDAYLGKPVELGVFQQVLVKHLRTADPAPSSASTRPAPSYGFNKMAAIKAP